MLSRLLLRLERAPRWVVWLLTFLLVALAGLGDWVSGADLAFTLAYLGPISLAAWLLGERAAVAAAVTSATTWLALDVLGPRSPHLPAIDAANYAVQGGVFLIFGLLLAALRRRLDLEKKHARTDALTGLLNRRGFWEYAEREVERCRRFAEPFSVVYLDIDGFKRVNDRYGHTAGDDLLITVATTLRTGLRAVDSAARLGGDEFGLLLPATESLGAATLLEKLSTRLATAVAASDPPVTFSIGCISVLSAPPSVDDLVAQADSLMYEVKVSGEPRFRQRVLGEAVRSVTPRER